MICVCHFVEFVMPRVSSRERLVLSDAQRVMLEKLSGSRTASVREAERAKVLLAYSQGKGPSEISRLTGVSLKTVCKCIDKALLEGVREGLRDRYHGTV